MQQVNSFFESEARRLKTERIMSEDNWPCTFSHQMCVLVVIVLQILVNKVALLGNEMILNVKKCSLKYLALLRTQSNNLIGMKTERTKANFENWECHLEDIN